MKLEFKKTKNGKAFFINLWRSGLHEYINPLRDWTVMLIIATFVFLGSVTYIAFDFYVQFGTSGDAVTLEVQPIRYRNTEIERYADLYTEKERVFNELRKNKVYIPEPVVEENVENVEDEDEEEVLADVELAQ